MEKIIILKLGENAAPCYGLESLYINDEHIQALKDGNRLYFTINENEYAVELIYEGGERKE